jgi:hypothetical protein
MDTLDALEVIVDACLLIGKRCKFMSSFKQEFSPRLKIDDLGPLPWILGCSIICDRSRGTLLLVQTQYTRDILDEFSISGCAFVSTPMLAKPSKLTHTEFNPKKLPYSRLLGNLLYVSNCAHLDITFSVRESS